MEFYLGQIIMGGWNFNPRGTALCDGQLLAISQNTALFSLLGTNFGGDGRTTFGLPDLRGRVPIHWGNGPGLSDRRIGQKGGVERVMLNITEIPSHNHAPVLRGIEEDADQTEFAGNTLANHTGYHNGAADGNFSAGSIVSQNVGGSQSHENMPPFQAITYCITLTGIFPSRS